MPSDPHITARPIHRENDAVDRRAIITNKLLSALPRKEYRRMLTGLEPLNLAFGEVLYEPGDLISHVYFPGIALVSLITLVDDHLTLEVGVVGCEGMVGLPVALGIGVSPFRALVQGAGIALRMKSNFFVKELRSSTPLQRGL